MVMKPLFWAAFLCLPIRVARLQPSQKPDISAKTTSFAQCLMLLLWFNNKQKQYNDGKETSKRF